MSGGRFDFTAPVPPAQELGAVHFIAVGGSGVSGVARMYLAAGISVSGSDRDDSATLRSLEQAGARVHVGHDATHLGEAETVVISGAIPEDNPELAAARRTGLRVLHRAQGIAALLHGRPAVAIAGANGKTTTSAMTTAALGAAGADPGYVIGAALPGYGTNAHPGAADAPLVVEADESDGSFLTYRPQVAVVTNVQPDHLDFYGDVDSLEQAYADFARTISPGGLLITNADDAGARRLADRAREAGVRVITWGTGSDPAVPDVLAFPDVLVSDLDTQGMTASGTLTWRTELGSVATGTTVRLRLPMPGLHTVHNAVAAALVATAGCGLQLDRVVDGLERFAGAHRRFERMGRQAGVEVVDDYAHNAPKVAAVVHAARSAAAGRQVVVAFQPHMFSRVHAFADGFVEALAAADTVLLLPIYGARERQEDFPGVTSAVLAAALRERSPGPAVHEVGSVAEAAPRLVGIVHGEEALVVTVGAGDVTEVGPRLLHLLRDGDDR